jgi:hypothetical protein
MKVSKLLLLMLVVCLLGLLVKIIDNADAGVSTVQVIGRPDYPINSTNGPESELTDLLLTKVARYR